MPQCLRQNVCQLLSGVDGLDLHPSFLDTLSNVVLYRVNMFTMTMEDRVLTKFNGMIGCRSLEQLHPPPLL